MEHGQAASRESEKIISFSSSGKLLFAYGE
jgi:hypothetical protein